MFWNEKFNLHETISTRYLKEKQYYEADCGCRKEYKLVAVDVKPEGSTYVIATTLYRNSGDMVTKGLQPIWDNKKIQAGFKKDRENEKKGIKKKEKPYKPTKYRKLTKQDYKDVLLAYYTFYKWAQENLNEEYKLDKIIGVINAVDFVYKGKAKDWNGLHGNDINTVENVDMRIAHLTLSKKQFRKFYDDWLDKKGKERDKEERDVLKGLICHKCEVPMVEFTNKHAFDGKGHHLPTWLRGRKCPKCSFTINVPKDIENYIEQNVHHYILFSDGWLKKNEKIITPEIKGMVKEYEDRHKRFDDVWKFKRKFDKKILKSLREEKKTGKKSKYFGKM